MGSTYTKEERNFLSTLIFPCELWWLRSEKSLQLGTNSRIKVHCSEMSCNSVKEHLVCSQWTAEGVCSHRYVGIDILVSWEFTEEDTAKQCLSSTFFTGSISLPHPSSPSLQRTDILLTWLSFKAVITGTRYVSVQWAFLFQLLLRRSKDGWCVDGTSCVLFSFLQRKLMHSYLLLKHTCILKLPVLMFSRCH